MDFIFKEVKKLTVTLVIVDIIILAISLIGGFFGSDIVLGIIYGFVFCELMFILLGMLVSNALVMGEKRAKRFMRINYAVRFVITATILVIPFLMSGINEWCVVVAMLSPKFTYFFIGFYDNIKELILKKKG